MVETGDMIQVLESCACNVGTLTLTIIVEVELF